MLRSIATSVAATCLLALPASSPSAGPGPVTLNWIPGSSVKLEQVNGDCDWEYFDYALNAGTCHRTTSQTATRFNILGDGFGYSWEDNGKLLFIFGDTISTNPSVVNYHAHDPIAWSTSTDPESGLLLNFFTNADGSPLFIEPSGVAMGADDIANSGITLADGVYLVVNTGADESLADPHQNAYSVLVRFDETAKTFTPGRTISRLPGGHFVFTSLHAMGSDVYMFGAGNYRASDIFLSKTPAAGFWSGAGTQYFAGYDASGAPIWSASESSAVPVVQDNPLGGPAWPNDSPGVGNMSVAYSSDLNLWLMTFDGGRQTGKTTGVYFTYATQPWGPWAAPQLIFNSDRDNGRGVYIHNPNVLPDPPGDGLNGPVIGSNDPFATPGGTFAPQLIERFTRVSGNVLDIYFLMSTWNPYAVVKMRSQFAIQAPASFPGVLSGLWWNSAESGWGISFTQRRNIVFAAWFTYDGSGNPKWYVAPDCAMAFPSASGTCTGPLYEVKGPRFFGVPFDPSAVTVVADGTLQVAFQGANAATMTYTLNGQSRTVPITRQIFQAGSAAPTIDYTDLWWNPSESGWGLSITQQFGTMFLAWYVYDANGRPVWYVASNCMVSGAACAGTLYRTTGPVFGPTFDPSQVKPFAVGTVSVRFSDGNNGTLSYTVNGAGSSKTITRQLF